MLIQHGKDAPTGVIESVGAETRIDRPRAAREDLTEMKEEMILKLECLDRALSPFSRSLQQSSSAPRRHRAN